MLRDPDLTPEAWRGVQRLHLRPLLVLPLFPIAALPVAVGSAVASPSTGALMTVAHLLALVMVASVASPWHVPRPPRFDPVGRTITFRARNKLGLLPLGLVLWGVVLLVHFELMRSGAAERSDLLGPIGVSWWVTLPLGFVLIGGGLYAARPEVVYELMVGVDGVHLSNNRHSFTAPWDQVIRLVPTVAVPGPGWRIEMHGPGLVARDDDGHRGRPTLRPGVLDSDAVRLWLTLEHYHRHPADREELGTAVSRRRRAQWRRLRPRRFDG